MVTAAMKLKKKKKKVLAPWKKNCGEPRQHSKKQRHHFTNKGLSSQRYDWSCMDVRVECQRIDAFELWCWRRLLRVPWAPRRRNESILKEINPEYSLEQLMLKLKLQYFGYLMQNAGSS